MEADITEAPVPPRLHVAGGGDAEPLRDKMGQELEGGVIRWK